ncbi:MAG: response regulator transcription factor [Clostridiales bacterium]|nr:response regulator transcription factor [Clostridiales bacterium]
MYGKTLIVIDSDLASLAKTEEYLSKAGCNVLSANSTENAVSILKDSSVDCIVCSIFDAQSQVRAVSDAPLIFLTENSDISSKTAAYEAGCDDYLVRPCDLAELVLRIGACTKRVLKSTDMLVEFSPLVMNIKTREVTLCGHEVRLTNREFEILSFLAETPNKTISIKDVYVRVWGDESDCDSHLVMVNISYIRKKLGKVAPDLDFVNTRWGVGYSFAYPPVRK